MKAILRLSQRWFAISFAMVLVMGFAAWNTAISTPHIPAAQAKQNPHILILNSYHQGYWWSDHELQGLIESLPPVVVVDIEYMDTKRFTQPSYLALYYSLFIEKFAGKNFDAIVTLDDNAFRFMLTNHPVLFPQTPVIFGGVNRLDPSELEGHPLFTGIVQQIDYLGTIETALAVHPATEQILIITDNSTTSQENRANIEHLIDTNQIPVEVVFLDDGRGLTLAELEERVAAAPLNSVIYYSDFFQDSQGDFVYYQDTLPLLAALSPVPIYVHHDFYLDYGATGGKVINSRQHGQAISAIVQRVLNGENPAQISVEPGPVINMFNYDQLTRWHISTSDLPANSLIINQPARSFYDRYRNVIWATGILSVAQTALIIYLILNIAYRRRAAHTLKESEQRYRSIVEVSPLPIAIHAGERFVFVNQAAIDAMGGQNQADFIGQSIKDFVDPAYWEQANERVQQIYARQAAMAPLMELKFRRLDGTTIDVLVTATLIDFEGKPASQIVFYDVTTRKQAEQDRFNLALERERVNMLRNFIADASHDLKNPLTTINTSLYMLRNQLMKLGTQDTRYLQTIDAQTQRLTRMVDDMLHMSRLDAAEQVEFEPINLNELVTEIVGYQQARAAQKHLALTFAADGEACMVAADEVLLTRAITNLVENAILYTPAEGRITITTIRQPDFIGCEVRDTGIGIPADDLSHIFERFYRSERARRSNDGGSGLGLAIAHKIITLHHGTIRASSVADQGSAFHIELPRHHFTH